MLALFISLFLTLLFYSTSSFYFSIVSFFFLLYYLITSPLLLSTDFSSDLLIFDEYSLFMIFLLVFVLLISNSFSFSLSHLSSRHWALFFTLFSCVMVFSTNITFILYLFYELSLLPIVYIIINWGSYPERSLSAIMFFMYTAFFTFPFLFYLLYISSHNCTFTFSLCSNNPTLFCSFIVFLCFSVNLPIYGLHFWLPMAHVEAPTFGSIILAGVLLNLGGIGLIRFSSFISWLDIRSVLLSYFFVFMLVATLVCCYQSDFNRLVAYSSVSHIMPIPILITAINTISFNTVLMLIFFHGFASPSLFMLVGIFYSIFSTRQLLLIRGVLITSPLLSFICTLCFFYTISAPPFPSFVAEVLFLFSSFYLSYILIFFFGLFLFFSLVYNLNWFTNFLFSSSSSSSISFSFSFIYFISLTTVFIITFIFVPLFFIF